MTPFADAVAAFDVEGWLEEHCSPRRAGPDDVVSRECPLCGARTGKFAVNVGDGEHRGLFVAHCCHESGNLVGLVARLEGLAPSLAARFVRQRAQEGDSRPIQPRTAAVAAEAALRPPIALPSPVAPASPATAIVHRGRRLTLADRLLTADAIARHGVLVTGDATAYLGERRRDLDRRVLWPVAGSDGALLSWQARDLTGLAPAKYKFPAGASVTDTLMGYDRWLAGGTTRLVVVEGFFQKLGLERLGGRWLTDAVASFGKKLTQRQEGLVAGSRCEELWLAWDRDAVPEMCKVARRLRGRARVFLVPPPPSGLDWDEIGVDQARALLERRKEATDDFLIPLEARFAMSLQRAGSLP